MSKEKKKPTVVMMFSPDATSAVLTEYRETPILVQEGYELRNLEHLRSLVEPLGLHAYHLIHDSDDLSRAIAIEETHTNVNYFGWVISPVNLFDKYITDVETYEDVEKAGTPRPYISLDESESIAISYPTDEDGSEVGYIDFEDAYKEWISSGLINSYEVIYN